jgi:hypothetical protein
MDPPEPPRTEDTLEALRGRVRETAQRAQRLAEDRPPPRGYDVPRRPADTSGSSTDLADLVQLFERTAALLTDVARGLVPPELRGQFADALRELLVALRALIDFYLERMDAPPPDEVEVEEIPIS